MLHFELRRIAFSSVAFLGPEFQLPVIPLSLYILHFKREKALELHHNVKYIIEIGCRPNGNQGTLGRRSMGLNSGTRQAMSW